MPQTRHLPRSSRSVLVLCGDMLQVHDDILGIDGGELELAQVWSCRTFRIPSRRRDLELARIHASYVESKYSTGALYIRLQGRQRVTNDRRLP